MELDEFFDMCDRGMSNAQYRMYKKQLYDLSTERDFLEDMINLYKEFEETRGLTYDEEVRYNKCKKKLDVVNDRIATMVSKEYKHV